MRILHTGDWHLGRTLEGRSRLAEQEAFLDELVQMVKEQQVDLVLMAGDVYDSVNPPAAAEAMFYEAAARLTETGCHLAVIAGNHDQPERVAAVSPLVARRGISLVGLPVPEAITVPVPRTGRRRSSPRCPILPKPGCPSCWPATRMNPSCGLPTAPR